MSLPKAFAPICVEDYSVNIIGEVSDVNVIGEASNGNVVVAVGKRLESLSLLDLNTVRLDCNYINKLIEKDQPRRMG